MRDEIHAIMQRLNVSQFALSKMLDIHQPYLSDYASLTPMRPIPATVKLRLMMLAETDKFDEELLAKLPLDQHNRKSGWQPGRKTKTPLTMEQKRLKSFNINNREIAAFSRRWNVKAADICDWLGVSRLTVYGWLSNRFNMPTKRIDKLETFSGDTTALRSRFLTFQAANMSPDLLRNLNWKQEELPNPHRLFSGVFDFYQPALFQAVRSPVRAELMHHIFECRRAMIALNYSAHNPARKEAYWKERLAAEKLLAPFVFDEGYDENYNVSED